MKYYLAPMEGITGYVYRNAFEKNFGRVDKYFTPFIVPNQSKKLNTKELKDILPENNKGMNIVPQILTNNSEDFILTTRKLQEFGYNEVNLNLGCPSGTVVSKFRGSGFLAKKDELDKFLEDIFKLNDVKISIKTRIGKERPEEFYELIKIYNKYPMEELIIHPRTQKDFYKNKPNLDVFKDAVKLSVNKLCYNGDIFTLNDYKKIKDNFKEVDEIMLGRGIIANPGLINVIENGDVISKEIVKAFHDDVLNGYIDLFGEKSINVLYKMKELWGYMICIFSNNKKYIKMIRKSQRLNDYKEAVVCLFNNENILEDPGFFIK